jgi:ketosteroid isomerase-like protein
LHEDPANDESKEGILMSETGKEVIGVLEAYKEAVFRKDIRAYVALYAEEAQVFDMWGPPWIYKDKDTWLEAARSWFDGLGDERVLVEMENIQIEQASEMAFVSAFIKYTAVSSEGKTLRWLENRLSCVLVPINGGWRIIHQHTSAPIDHTCLKAYLRRDREN